MKRDVIRTIEEEKLIAILRGVPEDKLIPLAQALYDGGIRLLEVTFCADGSTPDKQTASSIRKLADHFAGRMYIGAGTVLTRKQVALTHTSGGSFIISPNTDKHVIRATCRRGLVSIPGALTPSEICAAQTYGADFVKLFPITGLGKDYVKAVKAPISNVRLLAVGGIDLENMHEYLSAGVCGFGIGSSLTNKAMIAEGNWAQITKLAQQYTEVLKHG